MPRATKRHEIDLSDVEAYTFEHQMAGSFGVGERKELVAVVTGREVTYEVRAQRETVLRTADLAAAVAEYNAL